MTLPKSKLADRATAMWGSPAEFGARYGLSQTFVYDLIRQKKVVAKKEGSKTLLSFASYDARLASLPDVELVPSKKAVAS